MKKFLFFAFAILILASCRKKKTYCICYFSNVEVDRKETNSVDECAKRQTENQLRLQEPEVYCVIQED